MLKWGKGERSAFSHKRVFHEGPAPAPIKLTGDHYRQIADALGITPPQVRAIAIIESAEKPLTKNGNPVVRFESHHWKKHRLASRLGQSFDKAGNSNDLDERWQQFEAMYRVDPVAAVKSHSFGWPQIMGFNHRLAGCATTDAFLDEMRTIEGQNKCFRDFVVNSPMLHTAFKRNDAQQVALHYNGRNYSVNRYDQKFASLSQRSLIA
jgi:hypothetical protein